MSLPILRRSPPLNPAYCVEAQAVFRAFTTQPTAPRKAVINSLISSLKNAGLWSILDVLYIHAAADSQAALINWKRPGTFTAALVNAPSFTADRGFTGNGSNAYIETGFNISTNGVNFTQNSACLIGWSRSGVGTSGAVVGSSSGKFNLDLNHWTNDATTSFLNTASGSDDAGLVPGLAVVSRTSSTAIALYKDGSSVASYSATSAAVANVTLRGLYAEDVATGSVQLMGMGLGGALTAGNVTNFNTAMQAYKTAVGA